MSSGLYATDKNKQARPACTTAMRPQPTRQQNHKYIVGEERDATQGRTRGNRAHKNMACLRVQSELRMEM